MSINKADALSACSSSSSGASTCRPGSSRAVDRTILPFGQHTCPCPSKSGVSRSTLAVQRRAQAQASALQICATGSILLVEPFCASRRLKIEDLSPHCCPVVHDHGDVLRSKPTTASAMGASDPLLRL